MQGRPTLTDSARKRRKTKSSIGKINIFGQIDRWKALKEANSLQFHWKVSEFLLDWYYDHQPSKGRVLAEGKDTSQPVASTSQATTGRVGQFQQIKSGRTVPQTSTQQLVTEVKVCRCWVK
ncbi:uncharacterized protein LOC144451179 [Glandiceps talaboti]